MTAPILDIQDLTKSFGALKATDLVNLTVERQELHAVIGPNGAGKTTLIAQICGQLMPDAGSIHFDGQDITHMPDVDRPGLGLARSFQITSIFPQYSVCENVMLAAQVAEGRSFRLFPSPARGRHLRAEAMSWLDTVGLAGAAATLADALSYGQKRHLELAMALALKPRMLVLDEPLAGMGPQESEGIIAMLDGMKSRYSILLVEHDMDAVFALADRVSVLVYGQVIACGQPDAIRADAAVRTAYLGED
ncbi:MAG: ABC transporter ATP-binding protein [Pseudomonadota bacterium]